MIDETIIVYSTRLTVRVPSEYANAKKRMIIDTENVLWKNTTCLMSEWLTHLRNDFMVLSRIA